MSRLWRRLAVLWGAAIVASLVLLAIDGWFTQPQELFWLVPYPADAWTAWMAFVGFFRSRPLLVTAVVVLPAVALVGTVVLLVARVAASLARRRPAT